MLSNIVILSGLVPYSDLSCAERKCISQTFVMMRCKLKCLNVIIKNPYNLLYHTVASGFQQCRVCVTTCGLFSTLEWDVYMRLRMYYRCAHIFLCAMHVLVSLSWFVIDERCYEKVLLWQRKKLNGKRNNNGLRKREVTCSFSVTSMTKRNGVHVINEGERRENIT